MKLLDLLLLIPLLWGGVNGYRKGLLVELVGVVAFVAALIVGFKFLGLGMEVLEPHIGHTLARRVLPFVGFSVIFFPTIYLLNQFGYSIRRSLKYSLLGTFDSLAGAAIGLFTWVFGASVFFWLLSTMGVSIPSHRTESTYIYPYIIPIAPIVITKAIEWLPAGSAQIRDWKEEYLDGEASPTDPNPAEQ